MDPSSNSNFSTPYESIKAIESEVASMNEIKKKDYKNTY